MKLRTIKVFEHCGKLYKSKEDFLAGFIKTELNKICANMNANEIIEKLAEEPSFRMSFKGIINQWVQEIEVQDDK